MSNSTHLEHLSIRGFRGLEHVELKDLRPFNLIVGKNDVGKTSVLEATLLISGAVPQLLGSIQNLRKYVVTEPSDILLLLHRMNPDQQLNMSALTHQDERQLTMVASNAALAIDSKSQLQNRGGQRADAPTDIVSYSSTSQLTAFDYEVVIRPHGEGDPGTFRCRFSGTDNGIAITPTTVEGDPEESLLKAHLIVPGIGYDATSISDVLIAKRQSELLECLRSVHPQIVGIATKNDTAYVDIGLDAMIPLNMCGAGFVRAAEIFGRCVAGDDQILLIDEIGNGLRHSAIRPLIEALVTLSGKRDVQVFVTTHSWEVLRSLEKMLGDDTHGRFRHQIATFALARRQDDRIHAYRYDNEQFVHTVSRGIEIR